MEFTKVMNERAAAAEAVIKAFLPKEEGALKLICEAMNYSILAGGKRLRPVMMAAAADMFGGCREELIAPFMAAIEMIHTYSLVHDDLPAMDNDEYRRGRLTTWKVYGEDMAILAGDGLLNYAYETAAKAFDAAANETELKRAAEAMKVLASKPGIYGMLGGQAVDVKQNGQAVSAEDLQFIYEMKTSALMECSLMIGAILAGADKKAVADMEKAARYAGFAFQIQDDILDVTSSLEVLGKKTHSDEKNDKTTYVTLFGLDGAKSYVEKLSYKAIELLEVREGGDSFLKALLEWLIRREK